MKNLIILSFFSFIFCLSFSCKKHHDSPVAPAMPTTLKIVGITLDSAFQVTNPMYFKVTVQNSANSFSTTPYYLQPAPAPWYPAGIWNGLDYEFGVQTSVTVTVYFELGPNAQDEAEYNSTFTFMPNSYFPQALTSYPSTITFVGGNPAPDQTKITLSVVWK